MCNRDVVLTIIAITAKVLKTPGLGPNFDPDTILDVLFSSGSAEDPFGEVASLDQFRKSCLLAFYEFHQFPGHHSWLRIGRLTRMAYRIGLDQIDNPVTSSISDWTLVNSQDLEEWRYVWWCIYRFDSYSNITAGTPYLITPDCINAAFVRCPLDQIPSDIESKPKVFLSDSSEEFWKLPSMASSSPETASFNMHNITTAALREAGFLLRLRFLKPDRTKIRVMQLRRHLSALRLALPPNYFNPRRNALSNEPSIEHHERLVNVLHLHMCRLLLSLSQPFEEHDSEWSLRWQENLESCQDIAAIVGEWDSTFCTKVDPAISFILFTALIFLDLHVKSDLGDVEDVRLSVDHSKTVLHLLLEQLANLWNLPRHLLCEYPSSGGTQRLVQFVYERSH